MTDEVTTTADAQAAEAATTEQTNAAPAAAEVTQTEVIAETIDPETARKLRSEAKNLRDAKKAAETEAATYKAKVEAFEAEKLTETERLQKQADDNAKAAQDAAERLKSANLRAEVAIEAAKHGIDPIAASKLIADEVEYDDTSTPQNVTELVSALVEQGVLASKNTAQASGGLPANGQGGTPAAQETQSEALARIQRNARGDNGADSAWGGGVIING
jgi:hypothetical protein